MFWVGVGYGRERVDSDLHCEIGDDETTERLGRPVAETAHSRLGNKHRNHSTQRYSLRRAGLL